MYRRDDLTLLYVEDDRSLREQFERILRPQFKRLYVAGDGARALELYEQHHPEIMLVDINLPKIDGLEVIERIRCNDEETAIVVLSAYSDQEKLLRAIKLGLSEYLVKPVPYKKLTACLDEIASKFGAQKGEKSFTALQNGYFWQTEERVLLYGDEMISLTKRERVLLDLLVKRLNTIVTQEVIIEQIWENEDSEEHSASLRHLFKRLRKKLPVELIENIYAEGYRIRAPRPASTS